MVESDGEGLDSRVGPPSLGSVLWCLLMGLVGAGVFYTSGNLLLGTFAAVAPLMLLEYGASP